VAACGRAEARVGWIRARRPAECPTGPAAQPEIVRRLETMWREPKVPEICERMIGFSVPQDNQVLVISYEGTHVVRIGSTITVETDEEFAEYDIYDPESGVARYRGREYQIIGLHGGVPLLESPTGERLVLDVKAQVLSVLRDSTIVYSRPYKNFSGDWAAATFSLDGRYIVLGCPYDFDFVVLERCAV
jgi:hypothetical protein